MTLSATNPVCDAALYYIERLGFGLCAIPPGTKGPTSAGWNSPGVYIDSEAKARQQVKNGFGIGVIHSASGTCAIDIDHAEWATIMLAEFGIDLDAILKQGCRITSHRENRGKAIFKLPPNLATPKTHKICWPDPDTKEQITVIEFRGGAVQDILPPSIHKDTGKPYEWLDEPNELPVLPDILAQIWINWDKIKPQLQNACPWDNRQHSPSPGPINRPINRQNHGVIQQFNDAHDLRQMLEHYNYLPKGKRYLAPSSGTKIPGVIVFEGGQHFYSHHGSDIFGDGRRHDAFDLFCEFEACGNFALALSKAANMLNINQQPSKIAPPVTGYPATRTKPVTLKAAAKIPEELLNPPGILSDIAQQIITSAQRPQPVFAVNAALSLVATLIARKVQTETGLRSNLYLISLGPTGCGKEHARNYIKNMLNFFGASGQLAGEDIASGQGLMARAGLSPDAIFQIDEFGDFLAAATDKNSANHKTLILTNFMKLFSSAGSVVVGAEYANQKMNERQVIEYPCINLHATGTDGVFYDALKGRHILDGYLNRLIVTQTDQTRPKRQQAQPAVEPSQTIRDWYSQLNDWLKEEGGNLSGVNPAAPVTVCMSPQARNLFDELEQRIDEKLNAHRGNGLDSLFVRAWEQAAKIALVCGCAKPEPLISEADAKWSIHFVEYWTDRIVSEASTRIADSEFGSLMNLVLQQITKAGADGFTHGRTFNHKKLREIPSMTRQQIIATLAENDEIVISQAKHEAAGRPSIRYLATQFSNC